MVEGEPTEPLWQFSSLKLEEVAFERRAVQKGLSYTCTSVSQGKGFKGQPQYGYTSKIQFSVLEITEHGCSHPIPDSTKEIVTEKDFVRSTDLETGDPPRKVVIFQKHSFIKILQEWQNL